MYEQLRFEIRDGLIEIVNRYPTRGGAPGKPREEKRKKTPEEMERANERQRVKNLQRLIMANFEEGDFHLVLSYKKDTNPGDYDKAKDDLRKFLASMRRAYKKAGYEFKYIGVTERGKRASSLHHHLIIKNIEGLTMKTVRRLWKGHTAWHDLYEDGAYEDLAAYIVKKETKEENTGASYTRSRNLRVPTCKKVVYRRRTWPADPKPKKGWYIVKDTLKESINAYTGLPSQTYLTKRHVFQC